jgi:hypothetical protein
MGEPLRIEVERRREVEDVRVARLEQVRQRQLRAEEGARALTWFIRS